LVGVAIEEADADGEDDVEATLPEVDVLEASDEKLGGARDDDRGVASSAASIIFGERSTPV
jgi:hypothetical protein